MRLNLPAGKGSESEPVGDTGRAVDEESNRSAVGDVQPGEAGAGSSHTHGAGIEPDTAGQSDDFSARQAESRSGGDKEFDPERSGSVVEVALKTEAGERAELGQESSDQDDESDDPSEGKGDRQEASETPRVEQSDDESPPFQKSPDSETAPAGDRSDTGELGEYARKARESLIKFAGVWRVKNCCCGTKTADRQRGYANSCRDEFGVTSESPELQSTSSDSTHSATESAGSEPNGELDPSVSADNVHTASDVAVDAEVSTTAAGAASALSDDASCEGDVLPSLDENSGTKSGSFEEAEKSEASRESFVPPPQSEPDPKTAVMGATLELLMKRPADPNSTGEMAALPVPAVVAKAAEVPNALKAMATEAKATGVGIYAMLSVSQMSSFDEIHTQFLRKARSILQSGSSKIVQSDTTSFLSSRNYRSPTIFFRIRHSNRL